VVIEIVTFELPGAATCEALVAGDEETARPHRESARRVRREHLHAARRTIPGGVFLQGPR
jgi:hypothetical protein